MAPPEVWEMRERKPMIDTVDTTLISNGHETRITVSPDRESNFSHADAVDGDRLPVDDSRGFGWSTKHNRYATRKTAAQGMMDMALMLANGSQLKSVLQEGPSHPYYTLLICLIVLSVCLQIFTGLLLLVVGARESNFEDDDTKRNLKTSKLNNLTVGLVFLITVTNVFITSFGINGNTSAVSASGQGSGSLNAEDTGIGGVDLNNPNTDT